MPDSSDNWKSIVRTGIEKIDSDMALLRACLVEVLNALGEADVAAIIEQTAPGSTRALCPDALPQRAAQGLSIAFQLLNLVEENAAQQAIRARENAMGPEHESGLWPHYLHQLRASGCAPDAILQLSRAQRVEPVLTGHPTEAKRWSVLDQHRELYMLLVQLENTMYTDLERERIRERIQSALEHLWRTGEILLTKPDLRSERRNALYYFKEKFPKVLDRLDERFAAAWDAVGFASTHPLTIEDFPRLRFGSWVGGDRDGHPLVTPEVTAETLTELRTAAMQVLEANLRTMQKRLGLSIYAQTIPPALSALIERLRAHAQPATLERLTFHAEEPWRQAVELMRARLPFAQQRAATTPYRFAHELSDDLAQLGQSLRAIGAQRLEQTDVRPVQRIVQTFGFHLADLDIRQNAAVHEQAIAQLLDHAGLDAAAFLHGDAAQRLAFLNTELQTLRPFLGSHADLAPDAAKVVGALQVAAQHLRRHGRAGLGSLIISMTRSLSDLLAVYVLAREVGILRPSPDGPVCLLPVVPLFETIDDLEASAPIVEAFLQHPITRNSLPWLNRDLDPLTVGAHTLPPRPASAHSPVLQIMLGYSDSNKDSGILASQWALQNAQARLIAIGRKAGVSIRFFHGRGGTVSRGAGPTHRFLEALPEGSLEPGLRVTEQGETVAQKYTNLRTATYNLELLMAGSLGTALQPPASPAPESEAHTAMQQLATFSRSHYQAFLRDPDFIAFYRQATPIDALEAARIGSRPARRTGQMTLDDLRAIPWVFSWNQSRFYFPGWYGVGTAFAQLRAARPHAYNALLAHAHQWPFLRYVLFNIESGLASASTHWMQHYAQLVEDSALRQRMLHCVLAEFERTRAELDALLGRKLAERRPRFFKTLSDREPGLNLLHARQIRLLADWRAAPSAQQDAILPELLLTINAIASGLRTTG